MSSRCVPKVKARRMGNRLSIADVGDDVLTTVVSYVKEKEEEEDTWHTDFESRGTLHRLAMTCKSFAKTVDNVFKTLVEPVFWNLGGSFISAFSLHPVRRKRAYITCDEYGRHYLHNELELHWGMQALEDGI